MSSMAVGTLGTLLRRDGGRRVLPTRQVLLAPRAKHRDEFTESHEGGSIHVRSMPGVDLHSTRV